MKISGKWCPSGVCIGTSTVQCLHQWCGQWDQECPQQMAPSWVEWWHTWGTGPSRGTWTSSSSGLWEPLRFNKAKCKILHLNQDKHGIKSRIGGMNRLRAALQTLGCWWIRGWLWLSNVCSQPRKHLCSRLHEKQHGQQVKGWGNSVPLLCFCETPTWHSASSSGAFGAGDTWSC